MFLAKLALERPITFLMIYLTIVVISVYALLNIPLSLMPETDYPKLDIVCSRHDLSPEEMELNITSRIEELGNTIPGIIKVSSGSHTNYCYVSLEFNRDADMDYIRFEVNERLQLIKDDLPENTYIRLNAYQPDEFKETNFLSYGIFGAYETKELEEEARKHFIPKITALEGVSDIYLEGTREQNLSVVIKNSDINPVSANEIYRAVMQCGERVSVNNFRDKEQVAVIMIKDVYDSVEDLKNLKVRGKDGKYFLLSEVAEVKTVPAPVSRIFRYNGEPMIRMTIKKDELANVLKLSKKIKKIIARQKNLLPRKIKVIKIDDESEGINKELKTLYQRSFFSVFIIFIVLFIFLRHSGSAILILSSIFFSASLTFIFMYYFKTGLNMFSLAGLALGFGMTVDNSIVVYENIFRNRGRGLSAKEASLTGINEIALPVFASTLTTIIVFLPFIFYAGDLKLYFVPFIYSIVLSLLSSLFVAFTFIPLVSYKFLNFKIKIRKEDEFHFNPNLNFFQKIVKLQIRFRWAWVVAVMLFLGYSIWIFIEKVDRGFTFKYPDDHFIAVNLTLPAGSEIDQTDKIARRFEDKIKQNPDYKSMKTSVGETWASIRVDWDEELFDSYKPIILREKLKAFAVNFGGVSASISGFGPSFGGGLGGVSASHKIILKGYEFEQLKQSANDFAAYLKRSSRRIRNLNTNASLRWYSQKLYNYVVRFDREKLKQARIDIYGVISSIKRKMNPDFTAFDKKISDEEIKIKISESDFDDYSIGELRNLIIYSNEGNGVKLSEVASITKEEVISGIFREEDLYTRIISFDFRGSVKKARKFIDKMKKSYPLPVGYYFGNESEYWRNTENDEKQLPVFLGFAVILVYMVLASLFESFKYPFIILLILPLSFIGVSFIYFFTGESFTGYASFGLILLSGIVVNNSIIMVFRMNRLREEGLKLDEAVLQATRDRFRPVAITSLTTILGLLPMLFKGSDKIDFWRLLALSTIGGMLASSFFVMTFLPILYRILSGKEQLN
ncbi:MAG: hypothetical protein CSB55_07250 [Candidatus Cloacimonadota bacterium]|nr:MAG: hypothetical protein CSB55_07250 [Candidatus Cloacimonadota bacterium]